MRAGLVILIPVGNLSINEYLFGYQFGWNLKVHVRAKIATDLSLQGLRSLVEPQEVASSSGRHGRFLKSKGLAL